MNSIGPKRSRRAARVSNGVGTEYMALSLWLRSRGVGGWLNTKGRVTPIELTQRVIEGMIRRQFGRIINITSASVLTPIAGLDLSSGARAGLTGFMAGVAREVAYANVTINSILPGIFDTDRIKTMVAKQSEMKNMSEEAITQLRINAIPAGRLGQADEFGKACAFLASSHAGYITGQNLLIDGGAFRASF